MMMYRRRRRSYGFMFMIWGEARGGITAGRRKGWLHTSAALQLQHLLTCWKESSKSVCRETLIFTWLGNAFDYEQGRDTRLYAGWHSGPPRPCLLSGSGCPCTQTALPLSSPPATGTPRLPYSRGKGSGTGGTSSESSGRTPPGSHPACSCKSSTGLGSASPPALVRAAWPQQPHRLPGGRKTSGAQPPAVRAKREALNPLLGVHN